MHARGTTGHRWSVVWFCCTFRIHLIYGVLAYTALQLTAHFLLPPLTRKKLVPPKFQYNQKLICRSKVPLAKESFFGEEVMARCMLACTRDLPALLTAEKNQLKKILFFLFPQYLRLPQEFNPVWNGCINSIGQHYKHVEG